MNAAVETNVDKYLLGTVLMLATVLGGGTAAGLWTDTILQLIAVAVATYVIVRNIEQPIDRRVFWLAIWMLLAVLIQLLPISSGLIRSTQGILPPFDSGVLFMLEPATISLGPGRTFEVAAYFLTNILFLMAVMKLRFDSAVGLIPFFIAGVICNMTAGLVQYSFTGEAEIQGVLPYDLSAGFFANVNHFSSLVFISIPLAFAYFIEIRRFYLLAVYVACALLVLLAAGSMMGVLVGLAISFLSVIVLTQRNRNGIILVLACSVLIGIYSVGLWARIQVETRNIDFSRLEFARSTFEGIVDNLPFGIGYGNFPVGYPSYEKSSTILQNYINHAHNEYLELIFEGGLLAVAALAAFIALLGIRISETLNWPLHKAVSLAILFVLVHSVVDYPLRTLAVAFPFSVCIGLLFHSGPEKVDEALHPANMHTEDLGVEDAVIIDHQPQRTNVTA
ncbi:O-antigen ligase family protein [Hoeflea sp. TYP-13]|uniref:O-antigen ligase family protein n=1 Tax=Hoeflea sp. TYP-13 TaxID=3230023 RepID=UPI0034C61DFA